MLSFIIWSYIIQISFGNDLATYEHQPKHIIVNMVKKVNHGTRIIHDMCESLEEKYSFISVSNKPDCRYNVSYINNTDVLLFGINEKVRKFFQDEKKSACKNEKIECGTLTLIIKLLDLINSAIIVSINSNEIETNMELIEFDLLFETYIKTLDNPEVLSNITLFRKKANMYLKIEKERLIHLNNQNSLNIICYQFSMYIGSPVKDVLIYTGSAVGTTIGSMFGKAVEGVSPSFSISLENKVIIIVLFIIYLGLCRK